MSESPSTPGPASDGSASEPKKFPYRFGEVGYMMKVLKRDQIREALKRQAEKKDGGQEEQIGQVMIELGFISQRQVASILVAQKRFREEGHEAVLNKSKGKSSGEKSGGAKPAKKSASPHKERQKLGHFELIRRLGEGSMGAVFEAKDTETNRRVALKILPKNLASDAEFLERFRREVKTVSVLNHTHIVAYHGAGQVAGYSYLAMEFVDGESLSMHLKKQPRFDERKALEVGKATALALAHAHNQGMIHRDIKPENILLTREGMVKVTDFGLAKSQMDNSKLTAVGLSIGTPHYLSPEQALGREDVDHRADLYGVGVTLFHLLTGTVPFDHESSTQVMVMHVREMPPDPRSIVPSISRNCSQLVLKLLEKEPEKRYQTAEELAEAIDAVLEGKAVDFGKNDRRRAAQSGRRMSPKGCLKQVGLGAVLVVLALWYLFV